MTDQELEDARKKLKAWIRYHMAVKNLSQQDLAEKLGVSKGLITQWLGGTGATGLPGFVSLLSLSKELRVGLDVLLRVDTPPR